MESVDFEQLPLRDIRMPEPVSWWPPAPGWWLLAAVAAALIAYAALRHYRYRRHRAALAAIERIRSELAGGGEPVRCLQKLSIVVRRFAITAAGGDVRGVAGLTGAPWLEYLDARGDGERFSRGAGRLLLHAPYAPAGSVSREQALDLTRLCAEWIRSQRPGD